MKNLEQYALNKRYGENSATKVPPSTSAFENGIPLKSEIKSTTLTGDLYQITVPIQYLQYSGGLYDPTTEYDSGNIVSLMYREDISKHYELLFFRKNDGSTSKNEPPITDSNITKHNGIDLYTGGTFNTTIWSRCNPADVNASANTIAKRNNKGDILVKSTGTSGDEEAINRKVLNTATTKIEKEYKEADNKKINKIDIKNEILNSTTNIYSCNYINTTGGFYIPTKKYAKGDMVSILYANNYNKDRIVIKHFLCTKGTNIGNDPFKGASKVSYGEKFVYSAGSVNNDYWLDITQYDIPVIAYQYPEDNGNFYSQKEPAVYYKNIYSINTTWKQRFNNIGAFFRTEGGNADRKRRGLLQQDAGKDGYGDVANRFFSGDANGAFFYEAESNMHPYLLNNVLFNSYKVSMSLSRLYDTDNEFRPINIKVKIWELLTINGKSIWD